MRVLCVAEKPSIAKAIANALGGGLQEKRPGVSKFNPNHDIKYNFTNGWGQCDVVVTSVSGHIARPDFPKPFSDFGHDPGSLFHAPIIIGYVQGGDKLAKNIQQEARDKDILYIWTDCDREGEYIGHSIAIEAQKSNPRIQVRRAVFNNIEPSHLKQAASQPSSLDMNQVDSVSARQELDLRTGYSMTRLQSSLPQQLGKGALSYGSCQFPTMSFVVERYNRVKNFKPEKFWKIDLDVKKGAKKTSFNWARSRVFDHAVATVLYERMLTSAGTRDAVVTRKTTKPVRKYKPLPLTTVTLQKQGSKFLKMTAAQIMDHAEKLYQLGFLSYPRTETDSFDPAIDLKAIVAKQEPGPHGAYAKKLREGKFEQPRTGKRNDMAHPPIHPVGLVAANVLSEPQRKVYEYVTRHFLACCSEDAKGEQTTVDVEYGKEKFHTSGLVVLETNYLDIFTYEKWTATQIPQFEEGEKLKVTSSMLKEGLTSAPKHMTEPELVALMDANGIGTDATMADHIQKVKDRQYIQANKGFLVPTYLGCALYDAYEKLKLHKSVTKPHLRQETERELNRVAKGEADKEATMNKLITDHEKIYKSTKSEFRQWAAEVERVMGQAPKDSS